MTRRALVLAASLLAIALVEGDSTWAQVGEHQLSRPDSVAVTQPIVLAGPDVGFRIVRMDHQIPVGQIVVRINGAWVAAETSK